MKVKKKHNVKAGRFENIETVTGFRLQVSRKKKIVKLNLSPCNLELVTCNRTKELKS